ncbi:MAG: tetratricopeptide repeat protein [Planctomycetota bacterium]|jgi:tetratricopeptide (TPR) repeat protein
MSQRQKSRHGVFLTVLGLAALIFFGTLGCQGCQSQSGQDDLGDPDAVIDKQKKGDNPSSPGEKASPPPDNPTENPKEQALIDKMTFIEERSYELERGLSFRRGEKREVKIKKTLDKFQNILDQNPGDPRYMMLMARALLVCERFKESRVMYEGVLAKDPEMISAWKGIALSWAMEKKDEEKAKEALEHLQGPDIPGPFGLILIAEFWIEIGKDDRAKKYLLEAHRQFPRSIFPLIRLMLIYGMRKEWESAFEASEKALKRDNKYQKTWFLKARLHLAYIGHLRKMNPLPPDAAQRNKDHMELLEIALEETVKLGAETSLGEEASEMLKQLRDPLGKVREMALDSGAPMRDRERAFLILLRQPRETGIDYWKKAVDLPEKNLRILGIKGAGYHGGREGLEVLAEVVPGEKRSDAERSEAAAAMEGMVKRDGETMQGKENRNLAVDSLISGFRTCRKKLAENRFEKSVFIGIMQALARLTHKHYGEGRDHGTAEAMDATIAEWQEWWGQEKGK